MSELILNLILPHLLDIIAAGVMAIIAWAANTARQRWGIEIEATHREALQSAVMTGIRAALSRGLAGQAAVEFAVGYVKSSVPDALAELKPKAEVVQTLARSRLEEAAAKVFTGGDR